MFTKCSCTVVHFKHREDKRIEDIFMRVLNWFLQFLGASSIARNSFQRCLRFFPPFVFLVKKSKAAP